MPCSNITERIEVAVDNDDRVKRYAFSKQSCGRGIGAASLIEERLCGRTITDILSWQPDAFLSESSFEDGVEEFLVLKHLFAVQSALEVLTGKESGGPDDICAAAEVAFNDGEVVITALLRVDAVTDRIKACGNCKGCASKKPKSSI